jgi:hypothetical protein
MRLSKNRTGKPISNESRKPKLGMPLQLASKPVGLECFYPGEDFPAIDCPQSLPRRAVHVATVEWAWSPDHSRTDKLHLSTNKSRSHWILWKGYLDDNTWGPWRWEHSPYAFCAKKGVPAKMERRDGPIRVAS